MSLTSSLYTGTSGLTNMGNAMQVIGDNISNVNTVGFKGSRYTFADLLNQTVATQSGSSQMGRGMAIGSVDNRFLQGSFESTGNATDLSIGGNGFFVVRHPSSSQEYYTRAGNFNFDKDGKLINPEGYIVQGWKLDPDTGNDLGAMTNIILQSFTSPPKQTSKVTAITNLDADALSQSVVLANAWKASDDPPLSPNNYQYQTTVKAYDALGSTHDITIYYDKKSGSEWEYIITMNPAEDKRVGVQGTEAKGLLARGTILFNESDGSIANVTMEEFTGRIGNVRSQGVNKYDGIHFVINSTEKMAMDGFDFNFEFDGNVWNFKDSAGPNYIDPLNPGLGLNPDNPYGAPPDGIISAADKPANYPNAQILYSDGKRIEIALDPDPLDPFPEPDIVIRLDTTAVATDALQFDINDPTGIHVQNLAGLTYSGDTGNDNTTLTINDPSVMIRDAEGISLVWDAQRERWYMSNPSLQNVTGEDYTGLNGASAATTTRTVSNAAALTQYVEDLNVRWNGTAWDWNMPTDRNATFLGGTGQITRTNTVMTVNNPLVLTNASVGNLVLDYDGTGAGGVNGWTITNAGGLTPVILPTSSNSAVHVDMNGDGTADLTFAFNTALSTTGVGSTLTFNVDPAPPLQYPNAVITSISADSFAINFDGTGGPDVTWDFGAGLGAAAAGDAFVFDIDPRTTPKDYPNAVIRGDKDKVYIDLDGSGGENDKEDIVFSFTESMRSGANVENSTITFDIEGGTSWRGLNTSDMNKAGYFEFTADFLGSAGQLASDGKFTTTKQKIAFDIGTVFNGVNFINGSLTTTQYARSSSTTYQTSDGYGAGDLEGVEVSGEGVLTGVYSNGQTIPLYRVALAKFLNNQGLYKEGGNLYRATRESGSAITGRPGSNGLGRLSPNSLEMSNVDIGDEFVKMITTQRGFQANSKTVSTVDTMLEVVIQMKR
jgi:flagellar hook protein FlgE